MVNKKIVIICSILALIIVALIVGIQIKKLKEEENIPEEMVVSNQNLIQNQNLVENSLEEEQLEENQQEENQITEENTATNQVTETQVQGEEEENITELPEETNEDKALRLVQEEWGEDDSVYYTIDNQSNQTYHISVRSKSTTAALAEYEVDINQETVEMK